MTEILLIGGLVAAIAIAWQDFQHRWIHLGWLMVLAGCGMGFATLEMPHVWAWDYQLNAAFCVLLIGTTVLFFRLKKRQTVMNQLLGWGDVWMLLALACWFQTQDFLVFYLLSTIGTLVLILILRWGQYLPSNMTVPLAGAWAGWFICWQIGVHTISYA